MVDSTVTYERCIEVAGNALGSGDHASAERAFRAAIQFIEGVEGRQLELASVLTRLGSLKHEMGSYAEAEETFRRALNVTESAVESDDLRLISALTGLGRARIMRGAPEEAEPVITRALAIVESKLGADHPDLVILLNDLARLYLKQSAYAFAEPLLQRLLVAKRSKGEDHPEVATVLASLATVRQGLGRYEAAEQLWRRVLSIRERTLAPNHFSLATAIENLAETCAARGKGTEALQLYQRALIIRELSLGVDHASLRPSRERIADLQLQASEDSLDTHGDAAISMAEIRRPSSAEHLGISVAPAAAEKMAPRTAREKTAAASARERSSTAPAPEKSPSTPVREKVTVRQAREAALINDSELLPWLRKEKVVPPVVAVPAVASESAPAQTDAAPYPNTVLGIKDALEETDERVGPNRRGGAGAFFRRRRTAVMVGIGALTLPLILVAVAGAARSGQPKWIEQDTLVAASFQRDSLSSVAQARLQEIAARFETSDSVRDSTAVVSGATSSASRPREDRGPSTKAASGPSTKAAKRSDASAAIAIPTMPQPPLVRLDSIVRPSDASARPTSDSLQVQLSSMLDNTRRAAAAATVGGPVRARMIGALPTPQYPQQLLRAAIGGEVRVRFDVDTLGRPIMATFIVVESPDARLSSAVRRVVPEIRFEPARSPWPENRTIADRVELAFQFNPQVK